MHESIHHRKTSAAGAALVGILAASPLIAQDSFPCRTWPSNIPKVLAIADFDGDGRPDVASASSATSSAGVLRSLARGLFEPHAPRALGFGATAVAVGDFDGDGLQDLVVGGNPKLSLCLGTSGGTLAAPASIATDVSPRAIAVADFDLDGNPDLAIADAGARVVLKRNLGGGTFGPSILIPVPASTNLRDIAVGDVTGDGILDVMTCGSGLGVNGVLVRITGVGGFAFGTPQAFDAVRTVVSMSMAPLDANPSLDFALSTIKGVHVMLNAGGGNFGLPIGVNGPILCGAIQAGDFNGDGRPDLVVVEMIGKTMQFLRALPGGGFAPAVSMALTDLTDLTAADIDGDGSLDAVGATTGGVTVVLGRGDGTFEVPEVALTASTSVESADMNADGFADLVSPDSLNQNVEVRLGDGTGSFGAPATYPAGGYMTALATGRIDANGSIDVLTADTSNSLRVLRNDGSGGLLAPTGTPSVLYGNSMAIADFNGDTLSDVAVTQGTSCTCVLQVHFGDGAGGWIGSNVIALQSGITSVVAADLDGDGDVDLACADNEGAPGMWWGRNDGSGSFASTDLGGAELTHSLAAGDVDGNGWNDLVASGAAQLHVWRGLGNGAFAPPDTYPSLGVSQSTLGDFDNDGRLDVVQYGQGVRVFFQDGSGSLARIADFVAWPGVDMAAADVDSDGWLDLLLGSIRVFLLRNRAEATPPPLAYCAAKVNSLGCTPAIDWSGTSSASAPSGFVVRATSVRNRKVGLFLYGIAGRANAPFSGGLLCVRAPIKRTPPVQSGGTPSPANDCTGQYAIDMNAFAAGSLGGQPLPELGVAGTAVDGQFWGRDPGFPAPNSTTLSNAVEYIVGP